MQNHTVKQTTCWMLLAYALLMNILKSGKTFFISVDIDNYRNECQIIISFKFKVWFLFLTESRRNQTVNHVWNHGLCAPVCWTRWLFGVWCKENRTVVTLGVPSRYFTLHFLGNLSGNMLVVISLDIKVNVYHDISIWFHYDTIPLKDDKR